MSIALLCPTRGRPEQFKRMVESANATASEITVIAYQEEGDPSGQYTRSIRECASVYSGPTYPTVHKWNYLARIAMENPLHKLFMLAADDMIFETPEWDKALLDHYNALENKIHVYHLQDSRDHNGTPHPIITKEYMDAMGYFIPPVFLHWFVDSWTRDIAIANTCFTHLKDYMLTHDKPSDQGKPDETHNGIRRMGWHQRDTYVNETCQHFLEHEKRRLGTHMPEGHPRYPYGTNP